MNQDIFVGIEMSVKLNEFPVLCLIKFKINLLEVWHLSSNVHQQLYFAIGSIFIINIDVQILELLHLGQAFHALVSEFTSYFVLQSPEIKLLKT
jgi:hypothetical protein